MRLGRLVDYAVFAWIAPVGLDYFTQFASVEHQYPRQTITRLSRTGPPDDSPQPEAVSLRR